MSGSTVIEVFGDIVFTFTRSVTEHYNPEEPEFTAESFSYEVQVENGIIIPLINLFIKNTATEKSPALTICYQLAVLM